MSERTRDLITIAGFALSVGVVIAGIAFWAGGLDRIVRERVAENASDTVEVALREVREAVDEAIQDLTQPPIGTIVAFYGTSTVPDGWALCAGQDVPSPNNLPPEFDANPEQPGRQLPNLTGRFIRGTTSPVLVVGGNEGHAHQWARRGAGQQSDDWYSYLDDSGGEEVVDTWTRAGRGLDSGGGNDTYPLIAEAGSTLFTSPEGHLPPFAELRFIMRIR